MEIKSVSFARAVYEPGDFPRDGRSQIAIVGRSNVGKSSLINTVLNRKAIARVSQTPGKTQAIQFYLVNERFYLVDLPGYGYAKVSKAMVREWGVLIRSYLEEAESLRLLLLLLDSRRVPTDHDLQMHDWTLAAGVDERIVMTKTDKLSNNELAQSRRTIGQEVGVDPATLIAFSTVTRKGADQVRREIAARV